MHPALKAPPNWSTSYGAPTLHPKARVHRGYTRFKTSALIQIDQDAAPHFWL